MIALRHNCRWISNASSRPHECIPDGFKYSIRKNKSNVDTLPKKLVTFWCISMGNGDCSPSESSKLPNGNPCVSVHIKTTRLKKHNFNPIRIPTLDYRRPGSPRPLRLANPVLFFEYLTRTNVVSHERPGKLGLVWRECFTWYFFFPFSRTGMIMGALFLSWWKVRYKKYYNNTERHICLLLYTYLNMLFDANLVHVRVETKFFVSELCRVWVC